MHIYANFILEWDMQQSHMSVMQSGEQCEKHTHILPGDESKKNTML